MQNHWIDERRRKKPHESIDEEEHQNVAGDDGARITEARLTLDTVRELVEAMPDEQRSVLILVCVEEMSYREAADVLEVPIGTIMSRLSRARRALIEAMEENKAGRRAGASGDGS
jgi:RNA polymerase sigma-70 factor (ECF subfamily)